jgi:hypothetical protein
VSEFLAENPGCMPEEIEATIEEDGWDALAERELVVENMIDRRETAEKQSRKCLVPRSADP